MSIGNPFNLANVVFNEKYQQSGMCKQQCSRTILSDVIYTLAYDKPTWMFVVSSADYQQNADTFEVRQDGELLGTITTSYYRGDYCVEIENPRIAKTRERRGGYRTQDRAKAVAAVKKMFGRKSTQEALEEGRKQVGKTLSEQVWGKSRAYNGAAHTLEQELLTFANKDATVQAAFSSHLTLLGKSHLQTKVAETQSEMLTIESIKDKFDNGKTAVVVRVDGKYIVQIGDKVDILDDNALPLSMRSKIGMLKLVDDEHTITDVGCRVNSETFVILTEEEEPK